LKKIFIDTNIIIDLIADRKPFSKYAIALFKRAEEKKVHLFSSSHSIATTHYLLKKYIDEKALRDVLYNLLDYLTVIAIDVAILKKGLRSRHKDFEDAIQIVCASTEDKIDLIVTRNIKDYKYSEIPVLSPEEAYLQLEL
jgi:predicted nucleic acid-binding protein